MVQILRAYMYLHAEEGSNDTGVKLVYAAEVGRVVVKEVVVVVLVVVVVVVVVVEARVVVAVGE